MQTILLSAGLAFVSLLFYLNFPSTTSSRKLLDGLEGGLGLGVGSPGRSERLRRSEVTADPVGGHPGYSQAGEKPGDPGRQEEVGHGKDGHNDWAHEVSQGGGRGDL